MKVGGTHVLRNPTIYNFLWEINCTQCISRSIEHTALKKIFIAYRLDSVIWEIEIKELVYMKEILP